MAKKFTEYKGLDLAKINDEILSYWDDNNTFAKSVRSVGDMGEFIFYEGPPSANGIPGIHHVMARAIKDAICRYKTQRGYLVKRKAGWDTHGLPVELGVEKDLGITKEDIGSTIGVAEFNAACRKDVMKYTDMWEELTRKMGYWVDMSDPYITYDNRYIETLWWLLKQLYDRDMLYRGYTIQPYSPAAGTGLSSHELNLPGCYRDVKDTTCVALFSMKYDDKSAFLFDAADTDGVDIMAWTTTPWTLPSNTGLTVGPDIKYLMVRSFNPYTGLPVNVVLAKELLNKYFPKEYASLPMERYRKGDREIPYRVVSEFPGKMLEGISYHQLLDWVDPGEGAFRVVTGDFVTTDEGTGIVHIAPTFGADDYRVGRENGIPPLLVKRNDDTTGPLVDKRGRMVPLEDIDEQFLAKRVNSESYSPFAGKFVKSEYSDAPEGEEPLDVDIVVWLKQAGRAFKIEKYLHNYPHCWRTDKPILYYPMDSWFIRTTSLRDRMIELNNTINWKPASTGTGRFGKWLENLVDWNLSRSRYWGTPLPIWATEDRSEYRCIGSAEELKEHISKSVKAGFMESNPLEKFVPGDTGSENYSSFDLHRPFVDDIVLVSDSGKPMRREEDLIDVWFDSGAMPYAQYHYPFNSEAHFEKQFPADFIAEGVDQTRGWFFTLHAIAAMISDSVAFRNIISNGLVLDKNGNKMSKRLGNAVDPYSAINRYGSDPLRWYMITNAQPWDNLKFDIAGVEEARRKFFGTLYNTYSFFALYANIDRYSGEEEPVGDKSLEEIDRWIISLLNSLIKEVRASYDDYDLTSAGRAIQLFVTEHLSNWYVRLNRKRFWGGDMDDNKLAAYQTLHRCLKTVAMLAAPIAPFYMERLYTDLCREAECSGKKGKGSDCSVHLALFPECDEKLIDKGLEERMDIAQRISSMVLALRKKVGIKVRQPLAKMVLPLPDKTFRKRFEPVKDLVLTEVNVKEVEYIEDTSGIVVKKIKPDFRKLGPRFGKKMKEVAAAIAAMSQDDITKMEAEGSFTINTPAGKSKIVESDVEIISEDIPGWLVTNEGNLTVALDITISKELREEGIAREFINRIQNLRKESGFDVTDKIMIRIRQHEALNSAVEKHKEYIGSQTLASNIELVDDISSNGAKEVEIDDGVETLIKICRLE